jgi:hypothetical protein
MWTPFRIAGIIATARQMTYHISDDSDMPFFYCALRQRFDNLLKSVVVIVQIPTHGPLPGLAQITRHQ